MKTEYAFIIVHDGYVSYRTDSGATGSTPAKTLSEVETVVHGIKKLFNLKNNQVEIRNERTKKNPRPRIGASKPGRVSSATGMRPTKRLVSRRRANTRKGYFPNPALPAIPGVHVEPVTDYKGRDFSQGFFAARDHGRGPGWFVFGRSLDEYAPQGIIRRMAWPDRPARKYRGYNAKVEAGFTSKREAENVAAQLNGKPAKNPVRPLAIRAGIRFYRKHNGKWLMFDPKTYPAKTRAEAQKVAGNLARMFETQIKVVIDK
jgi:hypothetical protein